MAITINQEPTSPNLANHDLLFQVSSTQISQPQFQYVCDIKDNNGTLIQRIKQQANPNGDATFNLSQIIVNDLGVADKVWEASIDGEFNTASTEYEVYFGEEYGTSVSSSITLYDGAGSVGAPNTTGSQYYFMLDGVLNPQQLQNWNWASSSKLDYQTPSSTEVYSHQNGLTLFNTSSIRFGDYHTISFLNGNVAGDSPQEFSAQDVYYLRVEEYEADGTLIRQRDFKNRKTCRGGSLSQTWQQFNNYLNQTEATKITHFGVGTQNFEDSAYGITSSCAYYDVSFYGQLDYNDINESGSWGSYRFNIVPADCGYEGVRFAWKNQYGMWDYYNFTLAESRISNVNRLNYEQSFVDYNTNTAVPYDNTRRGNTNFYNDITKLRTAESDWLTQSDADNLRELFYSTDVYVQHPSLGFLPVVITDANITEKTNPRTQKLFKYTANYQYANRQQARL